MDDPISASIQPATSVANPTDSNSINGGTFEPSTPLAFPVADDKQQPVAPPPQPVITTTTTPTMPAGSSSPLNPSRIDISSKDLLDKDIFELMGIPNMPDDKKQELHTQMMETIEKRTFARVHDMLPQEDIAHFKELLDGSNPDDLKTFFKDHDIDVEKIMAQEAVVYKTEMVDLSAPLRKAQQTGQQKNDSTPAATDQNNTTYQPAQPAVE